MGKTHLASRGLSLRKSQKTSEQGKDQEVVLGRDDMIQ